MEGHSVISVTKKGIFLKFQLPQRFSWKNGPKIQILTKPVIFLQCFQLFKLNLPMSEN